MGDIGAAEAEDLAVEADALGAIGMTVELPTRRRRSRMVAKQEARLAGSRAAAKLAAMGHYKSNCPYAPTSARASASARQASRTGSELCPCC